MKDYKATHSNLKGYQLEVEAFNDFVNKNNINLDKLSKELNEILDDSHYRLMDGGLNLDKSNLLAYTDYFTDKTGLKYYGYIGKCKINSTTDGIIYQDLDNNYLNVIDETSWLKLASGLVSINAVSVPIDKL